MAFEGLQDKLSAVFKKIRSKGKLSESDVKDAMREVRLALLEADVNYQVAKKFSNACAEKCIGEKVMESLTPAQMVVKIVRDELCELMGGETSRINTANRIPTVIMMCGLQGSGKTTHSAKLAKKLKASGNRPMLVACDIYRPAAIDQLKVLGEKIGVPVFEKGRCVYTSPDVTDIRTYCAEQVDSLWEEVLRFEYPHNYYVDLSERLWEEKQRLIKESRNSRL